MQKTFTLELEEFKSEKTGKVFTADEECINTAIDDVQYRINSSVKKARDTYDKTYDFRHFTFNEEALLNGDKDQVAYVIGAFSGDCTLRYNENIRLADIIRKEINGFVFNSYIIKTFNFNYPVYEYMITNFLPEDDLNQINVSKTFIIMDALNQLLALGKIDFETFIKYDKKSLIYTYNYWGEKNNFKGFTIDDYINTYIKNRSMDDINYQVHEAMDFTNVCCWRDIVLMIIDKVHRLREDKENFMFYIENYKPFDVVKLLNATQSNALDNDEVLCFIVDNMRQLKEKYPVMPFKLLSSTHVKNMIVDGVFIEKLERYKELLKLMDL